MADRYDWDRDREREYDRGGDRQRNQDRGMMSRGTDEVRAWFGDDDARRRRDMDDQRDRQFDRQRDFGANSEHTRREHGWGGDRGQYGAGHERNRSFGDQRDFISRGNEWSDARPYTPRGREWYDPGFDRPAANWQGGSRDYDDEAPGRRQEAWRYSGGHDTRGQTSPYQGGYDGGTYNAGNEAGSAGQYRAYRGFGSQTGFGPRASGAEQYRAGGTNRYGSGGSYSSGTFAGRGPRNYQRSDERVREDVNERLTADPRVDASEIDVRVQNGEVTLSGTVDERRTRRLAEEIIEDMPGVRDVHNELRVNRSAWFGPGTDDGQHHRTDEQTRQREDGSLGHTGNPQQRDDVTTLTTKDAGKNR